MCVMCAGAHDHKGSAPKDPTEAKEVARKR